MYIFPLLLEVDKKVLIFISQWKQWLMDPYFRPCPFNKGWAWGPWTPVLRRKRQDGCETKANLGYMVRPLLKNRTEQNNSSKTE